MGHDDDCARAFAGRTARLVVAAQSVTARIAGELLRG